VRHGANVLVAGSAIFACTKAKAAKDADDRAAAYAEAIADIAVPLKEAGCKVL